ncbi:MAG TPA: CPBP family intramembrane glutamic endopeptidase [Caulobacteraceae bacterium]|jgi:hypothetical protein|nr:CPBP family intramembrane glutamic endopeptidase [Caulobacteraceae bacterium]
MGPGERDDPWTAQAMTAPRRAPGFVLVAVGLAAPLGAALLTLASPAPLPPSIAEAGAAAVLLIVALAALAAEGRRIAWKEPFGPAAAAWGFALALGGVFAATAVGSVAQVVLIRAPTAAPHLISLIAALGLLGVIAAGEEVFLRGWLQPALLARWGRLTALALAAAANVLVHLGLGERAPLALANAALESVVFGLLAISSGGLLAPMAAHFGWRVCEMLLGVAPPASGRVLDMKLHGGVLWTGGGAGLEGSLAATLALLLLLGMLAASESAAAPASKRTMRA